MKDRNFGQSTWGCLLVESFFKENHSTEVLEHIRGGEEELTKSTPVWFNILNIDAGKTFADCSSWLISSKNTLSRGANVGSIGNELICKEYKIQETSTKNHNLHLP